MELGYLTNVSFTVPNHVKVRDFVKVLKYELDSLVPDKVLFTIKESDSIGTHLVKMYCNSNNTIFLAGMLTQQLLQQLDEK